MPDAVIAVIDDDQLVRTATASLIRSLGFRSVTFGSAIDFLQSDISGVDCIVTDVQMPGLSGLDLHQALRDRERRIPVVLMTAYSTPIMKTQAKSPGIIALLEKPLQCDELLAAVERALA